MKIIIGCIVCMSLLFVSADSKASAPQTLTFPVKAIWTNHDHQNFQIQYADHHQPGLNKNVEVACAASARLHTYAYANGDGTCDFVALCYVNGNIYMDYLGTAACSEPQ